MTSRSAIASSVPSWHFLRETPGVPSIDGNITRLFNTGDAKPPACFRDLVDRREEGALSAVIYGREGIANCFDASQARLQGSGNLGLDFHFMHYKGSQAAQMRAALGLDGLRTRVQHDGIDRKRLGLSDSDCLTEASTAPLRVMTVLERFGGGLPGALDHPDSVLARALIAVGRAQESAGAAGSYGYGKAAVAQASKVRTVLAYSCFSPLLGDPVTRRLLGVTYWGEHLVGRERYTGWGLFGERIMDNQVRALEDADADEVAARLAIPVRDPALEADRGTTFLLVDPSFTPEQLVGAIELFWWPLMQRTREVGLQISVQGYDGEVVRPSVDTDHPVLGQFVRAFLDAENRRETHADIAETTAIVKSGRAGLTALRLRDPASPIDQSLVAFMRSPLMVVRYEPQRNANPPLVGVFVAHDEANENLRMVEPPEHDKWHASNVGGLNARPIDIEVSKAVRQEVSDSVRALHGPDPEPVYGISAFSKYFPAVDEKVARPTPPRPRRAVGQRLVRVNLVHEKADELMLTERPTRVTVDHGMLAAGAEVKFFLDPDRAEKVNLKSLDATLTIGARIAEDGSKSWENLPAEVNQYIRGSEQPFQRVSAPGVSPAVFEGRFKRGDAVYFTILTEPYPADWTVEVIFDCSPWDVPAPVRPRESND